MDSVTETMAAAAALGEAPDSAPIDVAAGVPLTSALLIFIGSGAGLGLAMYFIVCLSDLSDDLLNPYTLCDRVNSKLHIELGCHGAVVFGFLIAILGCYFGMGTRGGTEGVGRSTTRSVVVVSITILVADALLTQIFVAL